MIEKLGDILILDKQVGETPLECINRFKESHSEYQTKKMTYAGRLDPMASGVLVVLAGDMVHRKDEFLKLPKTYECTAILGIETDTYDVLGLPTGTLSTIVERVQGDTCAKQDEVGRVRTMLAKFIGTFSQKYPPYSSKTINGKQMHTIAREGGLEGLEIPTQTVAVKSISNICMASIAIEELVQEVTGNIKKVTGDFRQEETIKAWCTLPAAFGVRPSLKEKERITLVLFTVEVSGGTYIRGIVHELGQKLGIGACIISLKRTSVGDYKLLDK